MKVFKVTLKDHSSEYWVAEGWLEMADWIKKSFRLEEIIGIDLSIDDVKAYDGKGQTTD